MKEVKYQLRFECSVVVVAPTSVIDVLVIVTHAAVQHRRLVALNWKFIYSQFYGNLKKATFWGIRGVTKAIRGSKSNPWWFEFGFQQIRMTKSVRFQIRRRNRIVSNCIDIFSIKIDLFSIKIDLFSIKFDQISIKRSKMSTLKSIKFD